MIADFRYEAEPAPNQILLELFWDDRDRMGRLVLPANVEDAMRIGGIAAASELPVVSALSFAVFVAGQSGRALCVTGDRTVWLDRWGTLKLLQ